MTSRAVVTGTSSGIGLAVAKSLLASDWTVDGLSRSAGPLERQPGFRWQACDLAAAPAITEATVGLPDGPLDAIVHAAGLQGSGPVGRLDHEIGARMWAVHVRAAELLVDSLVDRVRDGGRILLVGSRTMSGVPGKSQYSATKAALAALARSWAAELAPRRITVNVVAPGPTETPMLRDPARAATPPVNPPLGRLIDPSEVAGVCSFLLGPAGAMVTGQTWTICGGTSLG